MEEDLDLGKPWGEVAFVEDGRLMGQLLGVLGGVGAIVEVGSIEG